MAEAISREGKAAGAMAAPTGVESAGRQMHFARWMVRSGILANLGHGEYQ